MSRFYGVLACGVIAETLLSYVPWIEWKGSMAAFLCFALIMYMFLAEKIGEAIWKWRKQKS